MTCGACEAGFYNGAQAECEEGMIFSHLNVILFKTKVVVVLNLGTSLFYVRRQQYSVLS